VTATSSAPSAPPDSQNGANISAPFIQRPVATSAADDRHPAGGIAGYKFLPLSALPEVDYPTIQVQTFLPGGSPDVMTTSVTRRWKNSSARCPA